MGMFDWIDCQYPLPDGKTCERGQSKDLACQLYHYTITKDGRMKDGEDRLVCHHGYLMFYGDGNTYRAKFTDGNVVWIKDATDESGWEWDKRE